MGVRKLSKMAPQPHNLKVGEKCWLVVNGEDSDRANCHEAVVTEVSDKNEYTVNRPAHTDVLMYQADDEQAGNAMFDDISVSGLSNLEGIFTTKKVVDKEGNGRACLCQMDQAFTERGYNDMVDMRRLNDAELARNLRIRAINKQPYCRCGVTLVAINLYEPRASYGEGGSNFNLFSPATQETFVNQVDREHAEPHPWSLASHCYATLFKKPKAPKTGMNDQSIVITGESGAGKTFTTCKILDFLADVGADPNALADEIKITDLMLKATPILEGFGNANMPRNPDSSRFGKLYKIYFDPSHKRVTGCTITPYMLEKSRLSSQQMNERNFHIFYRMLAPSVEVPANKIDKASKEGILFDGNKFGFSDEEKARYHIEDFENYVYLKGGTGQLNSQYERIYGDVEVGFKAIDSQPAYPEARIYDDAEKMSNMKMALPLFFTPEQIDVIWRVTSGCLWLGNIDFCGDDEMVDVDETGTSGVAIDKVADLWQVDRTALMQACNTETIVIRNKETKCQRSLVASRALRDSMARAVYDGLFNWMIEQMSLVLSTRTGKMTNRQPFIGVLDIFGFEFYPDEALLPMDGQVMNTLDQFNINMCNEVLQGEFVRCIFDLEQELYEAQLHETIEIDFENNYDTIRVMMDKKKSIIDLLDQQISKKLTGSNADKGFHNGLQSLCKSGEAKRRIDMTIGKGRKSFAQGGPYGFEGVGRSAEVPRELQNQTPGYFKLDHYAANVTYDVRDWVDKDRDKLTDDSYACLTKSQLCDFMVPVFDHKQKHAESTTVARDFANSLTKLKDTLGSTETNFVRCLKASNPLSANVFKNALVLNQLKYTGMLDTLIIRRGGFPVRNEFQEFCDQYRVLNVNAAEEGAAALAEAIKGQVDGILARLEEKPDKKQWNDAIRVGTPKKRGVAPLVLMRDWLARELDEEANIIKGKSAVLLQAAIRMGFASNTYRREIAARDIQCCMRSVNGTKPYSALRGSTMAVLPEARGLVARAISSRASEINSSASQKSSMVAFLQDNVSLQASESAERKLARAEDDYSEKIANARFGERIEGLKADSKRAAELAYKQAMESVHVVNDVIDNMSAKSAEIDARWAKMQTEGVVRSVPLVRQYKASAQPFNPPDHNAYKFRYSFTYKGTAEAQPKAAE